VRLIFFAFIMILFTVSTSAEAKSYTKGELKKMVATKKYPKTENPKESTSPFDFSMCKTIIYADRIEKDEEGYPTQIVTEKKNLVVIRTWQSHMTTTSTCKEGTGEVQITDSNYAD
jgi:hypothetical protein